MNEVVNVKPNHQTFVVCAAALISFSQAAYSGDDSQKLDELRRALTAPGTEALSDQNKRPVRTRAIVFDNAEPSNPQTAQPAQSVAQKVRDCTTINPESPGTAVDFVIQFAAGSASIAASSEPLLEQIGKVLALDSSSCVVVEGHTDISGSAEKNMSLSQARAESVVKYLSKSVDRTRMLAVGKGSLALLKDIDPRSPKHRRVVFKVVNQ